MSCPETMVIKASENSLELVFCATMENVDLACTEILGFLENLDAESRPNLFAIHLGLREGLTNAVRHGNKNDATKTVTCRVYKNQNQCLEIDIEDQGNGFDWKKRTVSIPDDDAEHGRGLAIIEKYCASFRFNEKGNCLTLQPR